MTVAKTILLHQEQLCVDVVRLQGKQGGDTSPASVTFSLLAACMVSSRGSVVVSTPTYHAADRGSNPARIRRDYYV